MSSMGMAEEYWQEVLKLKAENAKWREAVKELCLNRQDIANHYHPENVTESMGIELCAIKRSIAIDVIILVKALLAKNGLKLDEK